MSAIQNTAKVSMRQQIKVLLNQMSVQDRINQSSIITNKILSLPAFQNAHRISIYLSLPTEVNTIEILKEMFNQRKQVFVPCYRGKEMMMVKLNDFDDYENLPLTKWNIRQPKPDDNRENANNTGGLDLILAPGVAFTKAGGRCGHGMGYYDKYFKGMFEACPERGAEESLRGNLEEKLIQNKTILLGLAFNEQIVNDVPLDESDVILDGVITADVL